MCVTSDFKLWNTNRKTSEFLDSHVKTIMQEIWSYIKDSADFISIVGQIVDIPENAILVTADLVGFYHSIPRKTGLKALKNALEKKTKAYPY